jgi:hypothetical protein
VPYQVRFIDDDALPTETDWAIVSRGNVSQFFVKRSRVTPDVLAEAWAAWEDRETASVGYSIANRSPAAVNA